MNTITLAFVGTALICAGSFFAIVAPGDGQTGMVTFPLWVLGAVAGIVALGRAARGDARSEVLILAGIAIASVVWSFLASVQYSRDWKPPVSNSGKPEISPYELPG